MSLPDVKISKAPGLGRPGSDLDGISGILVAVASNADLGAYVDFNKVIKVRSLREAENAFILPTNAHASIQNLHEFLRRFFLRAPGGSVWIEVRKTTETVAADFIEEFLPGMLERANGEIRQVAIVEGLTQNVTNMVTKAQAACVASFEKHAPVVAVLGLRNVPSAASAIDLRTLSGNQVGVYISTDKAASQLPQLGDVMGYIALARVNENIGWVQKFPLTDTNNGLYAAAYFTNEILVDNAPLADLETYHEKGYIFARRHAGISGYYFNSAPTAVALTNDEAYLENARTLNKAARVIRADLLPRLNSPVLLTEEGKVDPAVLAELEAIATQGLTIMQRNQEVSAFAVTINPDIAFIENDETLDVDFEVVPVGVARRIKGNVKLVVNLTTT